MVKYLSPSTRLTTNLIVLSLKEGKYAQIFLKCYVIKCMPNLLFRYVKISLKYVTKTKNISLVIIKIFPPTPGITLLCLNVSKERKTW